MTDPISAPIYVQTEWDVDFFYPGPGLPVVTPLGVFVGDQITLDAVAASAGVSCVVLTYSVSAPPGSDNFPAIDRAFVRYDEPQPLDLDQQQQARENIRAARLYTTGDLG